MNTGITPAKYTLAEFIAALESEDFDSIDSKWLTWANGQMINLLHPLSRQKHDGDCTKQPFTCSLCLLQHYLEDYKQYFFNEEAWRKDNLI